VTEMNAFIAGTLVVSGAVVLLAGTVILLAAAVQALRPMRTTAEAAAVDADGVAKVLEMLSKLPQWLLAILAGDFQLWLAMRVLAGQPWWPS
jgi:hypothetical protein